MRIISKFQDYYDAGMAQGQDRSLVFLREHQEVRIDATPFESAGLESLAKALQKRLPRFVSSGRLGSAIRDCCQHPGLVLFAGRLYPYVKVTLEYTEIGRPSAYRFFYDEDSLKGFYAEIGRNLALPKRRSWGDDGRQTWDEFFPLNGNRDLEAEAIKHRLPVVALTLEGGPSLMHINPQLKQLEFYRCLDTWQAYQELSMFVGNLAQPDPVMAKISEKQKVAKHGFDEWSFRTMPKGA